MLVNEARVRDVVEPAKRHALQEEKPRVLSDAEVAALLGHHEDALPISDYNLSIAREAIETSLRTATEAREGGELRAAALQRRRAQATTLRTLRPKCLSASSLSSYATAAC